MKKIMMFVSTLMMAATMNAMGISNEKNDSINEIITPNTTINKTTKTDSFTKAILNVPAKVRFIEGENYEVNMTSDNEYILKYISCDVKDGTLSVKLNNVNINDGFIDVPVVITVVTPEIPAIDTSKDYILAQR